MTRTTLVTLALSLLCVAVAQADNVYRWTDENGEVHFGATLPPEYANQPHEIINQAGIVIRRVDPTLKPEEQMEVAVEEEKKGPEPLFTEEEIQIRSDRLLVLKYHSEEDIFEAMDVEVANLGYDARIIDQSQTSLVKSMSAQIKEAADRQRAGMPADSETDQKIAQMRYRLRKGAEAKAALLAREEKIRAGFMEELERYRYLHGEGPEGGSP